MLDDVKSTEETLKTFAEYYLNLRTKHIPYKHDSGILCLLSYVSFVLTVTVVASV